MSITFEQDRMFSTEVLVLEDRQLVIRGRPGIKREQAVWLRDVAPDVQVITKRFYRFYVLAAIFPSLFIGFKHYIEPELSDISLIGDTVLVLIAYFASSQYFKPIDIYQIRTKNNALIIQLYASKAKQFKCEDFMKAFNEKMTE